MDIRLNKTALAAVLGLGLAGIANAAGFTPPPACTANPVTIPCENEAWDVAIEGLYWKPIVYDKTTYLVDFDANNSNDAILRRVEPDFEWGFRLEGSYHFGTGNDLTVNWTRLRGSEHAEHELADWDGEGLGDYVQSNSFTWNEDVDLTASIHTRFDAVNAEFGQHFDVGNNLDLRVHGGAQYARIEVNQDQYIGGGTNYEDGIDFASNSEFRGFGPRVGMDWNYHLGNGVDFVARFAGEVLVGKTDSSFGLNYSDASDSTNNWEFTADGGDRSAIVPGAEGRLGMSYTHDMNDDGSLILEGGWHAAAYTNAVVHLPSHALTTATFEGFNSLHDTSSYGQHGPYLELKYISNKI